MTGSDDGCVKLWETTTGRCFREWKFDDIIDCVVFNPVASIPVLAVACGTCITLLQTLTDTIQVTRAVEEILKETGVAPPRAKAAASWELIPETEHKFEDEEDKLEVSRLKVEIHHRARTVVWHNKGDYFATVSQEQDIVLSFCLGCFWNCLLFVGFVCWICLLVDLESLSSDTNSIFFFPPHLTLQERGPDSQNVQEPLSITILQKQE